MHRHPQPRGPIGSKSDIGTENRPPLKVRIRRAATTFPSCGGNGRIGS